MFIKNQKFSDEDTLLEQLFDFGLGDPSSDVAAIMKEIDQEVLANKAFQEYKAGLTDEEEIMEVDDEERRIRLAEKLMELYESFEVFKSQLFGISKDNKVLLYSIDLY
ncbi:hypothetical protein [Rurimicrobium arvi]|uniref:Uncharacterized protein n=1 Tax=Rurimicrobium arvi TaxID=2049916 RepID=A0ABP8ML95_9BACT